MLPNLARGSSSMSTSSQPPSSFVVQSAPTATVPEVYSPSQPEPPAADEMGSSTPVMDEPEEKDATPPQQTDVPSSKATDSKTKTTPIDFLSQLLTKTNNSSSSSSNFLQTLSLLTNTVKSQYKKQPEPEPEEGVANDDVAQTSPTSAAPPDMTSPAVSVGPGSNWGGWKPVQPSQPPLPAQDPSSPPIIGQVKPEHPPPLPQHPPRPPEPLAAPPFSVQPPGQDFSLPPPLSVAQSMSQPYRAPPVPSRAPFPPRPESSNSFPLQAVSPTVAAPMLTSPRPNMGFNQSYQFPGPVSNPEIRPPPLPAGQPPLGVAPPPGFIPRPGNTWEQPPAPILQPGVPPPTPPNPPPFSKPFVPPPPPPDANNPWQQPPQQPPPPQSQAEGFNQISSIPSQRGSWGSDDQDFQRQSSWDSSGDNQQSGYAHPWDQPQDYDEDEEDSEYVEPEPVNTLPPPPKKSILRNSRTSSLREISLVDESNSGAMNQGSVTQQSFPEVKPTGILKRPLVDMPHAVSQSDDQSEFINILKQKSSANLPPAPPSRMLTTITPNEGGDLDADQQGVSAINTIGVLGHRTSVNSDDMEIESEEHEEGNHEQVENSNWEGDNHAWASEDKQWTEKDSELQDHGWDNRNRDFQRRNSDSDRNFHPHWQEHHQQRPWRPRGPYGHDNFRPRNFAPRPRFGDNFHGPSPAKRPFYQQRPRMPYYRH